MCDTIQADGIKKLYSSEVFINSAVEKKRLLELQWKALHYTCTKARNISLPFIEGHLLPNQLILTDNIK